MTSSTDIKPNSGRDVFIGAVVILLIFVGLYYSFSWWTHRQVIQDATEKYEIALRHGDKNTACFEAGAVVAGYLSAKNEQAYAKWRVIQHQACGSRIPDECLKRYDLTGRIGVELPRSEFCKQINP